MQPLTADQEFLATIRDNAVVEKIQAFCVAWSSNTNGNSLGPRELADLLYDVSLLAEAKRVICEKVLLDSKVFPNRRTLQKALKAASPESTEGPVKPTLSADFEGLIDLVEQNEKSAFLIRNSQGLPEVLTQVEHDKKRFIPPSVEQVPWLLPRAKEVLDHLGQHDVVGEDSQLFEDLITYHRAISELPSERHYLLLAAFDLHTYLMENFEYSPMLCFYAVPERGKSRTGKGIIYLAFHGIHVESLREAYIVRVASDCNASLFFDVMDIWRKAEKTGTEDIILSRFERGTKVPRVLDPTAGPWEWGKYFKSFGPTIIATNEDINHILETRVIPITMPDTSRQFEENVTPRKALPLKERLVAFRFRHYGDDLPATEKPAKGRLGDILRPLLQIIRLAAPQYSCAFMDLVGELENGRKVEKAETLEAELIRTIVGLKDRVVFGYLAVKEITETINKNRRERFHLSPQKIGRKLKALGFERGSTANGASSIAYDEIKIRKYTESYGLKQTSEMPGTLEKPGLELPITEVSEVSDVSNQAHASELNFEEVSL